MVSIVLSYLWDGIHLCFMSGYLFSNETLKILPNQHRSQPGTRFLYYQAEPNTYGTLILMEVVMWVIFNISIIHLLLIAPQ